ncbi:protein phosphatase 1 regulatory subunit 3E [Anolis carolinensis]|uniref:protein phosphatase 1 regulatory subunit 3E n=1 Tax=Anolis carolinensis TaxID=28377 RepID=UPI000203AD40|nr:PREDICTED: protein phosphatase 1 regulatory subunit 3E [Anolis carolinensis]|eukprot:XP_003228666.1 PREDICTED: protein phosphatase 1 regulatory subunit 3E [Anolis carolinensis]
MACAPPSPLTPGNIPRNLSYIAGLYERAYYRTARPSLAEDSGTEGSESESEGRPRSRPRRRRHLFGGPKRRGRRRTRSAPARGRSRGPSRSRSPGTRKRVRFADSLGLELTSVRQFWPNDLPQVPERVHTQLRRDSLSHFAPCLPFCPPVKDPLSLQCLLEPTFLDPLSMPDFSQRLLAQCVLLEGARAEGSCVSGTIRVLNLAYEKRVSVRYTWDYWATKHDARASYAAPAGRGRDHADRFAFRLLLPVPLPPGVFLEFALCYLVGGKEFWDNNEGRNYSFRPPPCVDEEEEPPSPTQDCCETGWIHFL